MSMLLHRAGLILPPGPSRRYNGTQTTPSGGGTTVGTFAAVPIGPASSDRLVVICINGSSFPLTPIVSATIGGVAATIHTNFAAGTAHQAVMSANVPAGTTADVVVTYGANISASPISYRVFSYSLYRLISHTPVDIVTTTTLNGTSPQSMTINLDIIGPEGIAIALARAGAGGSGNTWTGLTEDADVVSGNGTASAQGLATETGRTITAQFPGATSDPEMVGLSWA